MMSYAASHEVSYACPSKQALYQTGKSCNVLQSLSLPASFTRMAGNRRERQNPRWCNRLYNSDPFHTMSASP